MTLSLKEESNLGTDTGNSDHQVKTQTQKENGHGKTEGRTEVVLPQTRERLGPPEARKGKEGSSPRDFRGSTMLPIS